MYKKSVSFYRILIVLFFFISINFLFKIEIVNASNNSYKEKNKIKGSILSTEESTQIEFIGKINWDYKIEKNKNVVSLILPPIDDSMRAQLLSWSGIFIKNVEIIDSYLDGKTLVKIFLKNNEIEIFDYLSDHPSRLVVDLFLLDNSEISLVDKKQKSNAKNKIKIVNRNNSNNRDNIDNKDKNDQNYKKDIIRKPADILVIDNSDIKLKIDKQDFKNKKNYNQQQTGIYDGADPGFSRFTLKGYEIKEEAIIASQENIYLPFPMLTQKNKMLKKLLDNKPVYQILPEEEMSNKEARFILMLYNKKRFGFFSKAVQEFFKKYPYSKYDELLRFMLADAHYQMWEENNSNYNFEKAMDQYTYAINKYPDSILKQRTTLLMGLSYKEKGDYVRALQILEKYLKIYNQSPDSYQVRLNIADVLMQLNHYDDALKTLNEIENQENNLSLKIEACYLKGDIFFQQRKFKEAITYYKEALKKYPQKWELFSGLFFNLAESYFWIGEYKKSLDAFNNFINRYPSSSHSSYAITRIGELLEILGADEKKVMSAFHETYFRYGSQNGAEVARIRMLNKKMKNMKKKELKLTIEEMHNIIQTSQLPYIEEFVNVMISDGYSLRKDYIQAIDVLKKYYADHPTTSDYETIKNRIIKNINLKIIEEIDGNNFLEALKVYQSYLEPWLKNSKRIDTYYHLGRAFEMAGVFEESDKLYKKTANHILAVKNTIKEKEKNIFEKIPSIEAIYLRLAAVNLEQGNIEESLNYLKQIKNESNLDKKENIEKLKIFTNIYLKQEKYDQAENKLLKIIDFYQGVSDKLASPLLHLGKIKIFKNQTTEAIKYFQQINNMMDDTKKISKDIHQQSLALLAKSFLKQNRTEEAISTYQNLLDKYGNDYSLENIRYKLGQLYYNQGKISEAKKIWDSLLGKEDSIWNKLARQNLKNSKWHDTYDKYINRIPAMANMKKEKK